MVAGVAPATLTFVVRTLAVLRTPNTAGTGRWQKDVACALPVGGHQCWESREKCCASVGFEPTSPSNPGWYANRYTTRQLIFTLLYPRVIVPPQNE
ncbi:hypothetical protein Zmor_014848 [Zophobas morio]|uniref:Secreted protein n=1 Tax=Zophobas morio TaxID=2755281 RepID=A0AA38II82_9CUCU|nr:hypothetical protein Zmor_014848 [Zophobas morio]